MPIPLGVPSKSKIIGLYGDISGSSASMGNKRLDIALYGGLPDRSNILFVSPSSNERDIFLIQFANAGIENGENVIYITTDKSPDQIFKYSDKFKWKLKEAHKKGQLHIIDCYSWTLGKEIKDDEAYGTTQIPGPNALNDISIALSKVMEQIASPGKKVRVIFNSVSTLLLYNNNDTVFKFLQITGARLKSLNATIIYTLEDKMHDGKTMSTLQHLTDALIKLEKNKIWHINASWAGHPVSLPAEFNNNGLTIP
ncbi:RAD55 family ATPase [Candidatus Micrarchaeota archaeon]|jgi:KaiC/GvpD/RAD55 family RecA-like ATPase|nr:RAD55 family ATPase [Candidatus Micrarchaeota archaeon]